MKSPGSAAELQIGVVLGDAKFATLAHVLREIVFVLLLGQHGGLFWRLLFFRHRQIDELDVLDSQQTGAPRASNTCRSRPSATHLTVLTPRRCVRDGLALSTHSANTVCTRPPILHNRACTHASSEPG